MKVTQAVLKDVYRVALIRFGWASDIRIDAKARQDMGEIAIYVERYCDTGMKLWFQGDPQDFIKSIE